MRIAPGTLQRITLPRASNARPYGCRKHRGRPQTFFAPQTGRIWNMPLHSLSILVSGYPPCVGRDALIPPKPHGGALYHVCRKHSPAACRGRCSHRPVEPPAVPTIHTKTGRSSQKGCDLFFISYQTNFKTVAKAQHLNSRNKGRQASAPCSVVCHGRLPAPRASISCASCSGVPV